MGYRGHSELISMNTERQKIRHFVDFALASSPSSHSIEFGTIEKSHTMQNLYHYNGMVHFDIQLD